MFETVQAEMGWIWLNLLQFLRIFGTATFVTGLFIALVVAFRRRSGQPDPPMDQEPPYDKESTPTLRRIPSAPCIAAAEKTKDLSSAPTQIISREQLVAAFRHGSDLDRFLDQEKDLAQRIIQQTRSLALIWRERAQDPLTTDAEHALGREAETLLHAAEEAYLVTDELQWPHISQLFFTAKQRFYQALLPSTGGLYASAKEAAGI